MNNDKIVAEFNKQYEYLKVFGLEICGIANLIGDHNVISISTPFIFDRTKLPKKFMGLNVREGITELPEEFQKVNNEEEYIWAFQRFEEYVDNHSGLIRKVLHNNEMSKTDMLDALCFGDFIGHKKKCIEWENEGQIPKWVRKERT